MPVTPIDLASLQARPNPLVSLAGDGGLFDTLLKETDALLAPKPEFDVPAAEQQERPERTDEFGLEDDTPRNDALTKDDQEDDAATETSAESFETAPIAAAVPAEAAPAETAPAAEQAPGRTIAELAAQSPGAASIVEAARTIAPTATTAATPARPAEPALPATGQAVAQTPAQGGKTDTGDLARAALKSPVDPAGAPARGDSAAQVVVAQSAVVSRPQATLSSAAGLAAQEAAASGDATPDQVDPRVAGTERKTDSKPAKGAPHAEAQLDRGNQAGRGAAAAAPVNAGIARATLATAATPAGAFGLATIAGGELPGGGSAPAYPAAPGVATGGGPAGTTATANLSNARPAVPNSPAEQVATRIQSAIANGEDKISVKLHPAELGRIEVNLRWSEDGVLRAALVVDRAETLDLLQRDARELDRVLQGAGLKTDFNSLSFDLRDGGQNQDNETGTADGGAPASNDVAETGQDGGSPPARAAHDGQLDLIV